MKHKSKDYKITVEYYLVEDKSQQKVYIKITIIIICYYGNLYNHLNLYY